MDPLNRTYLSPQRTQWFTSRSILKPASPLHPNLETYFEAFIPRWGQADLDIWHNFLTPLVKELVTLAGPPTEIVALRLLSITAAFALWSCKSFGTLNPKSLWDAKAIEYFVFTAFQDPDGARVVNDAGFSKIDVSIGHKLADLSELSPKQAALGAKLVGKYHRQIPQDIAGVWKALGERGAEEVPALEIDAENNQSQKQTLSSRRR